MMQEAEAEQVESAKQAKAAAKRAAVEAAAAQRAEEVRKRHEFMQETNKVCVVSYWTYLWPLVLAIMPFWAQPGMPVVMTNADEQGTSKTRRSRSSPC